MPRSYIPGTEDMGEVTPGLWLPRCIRVVDSTQLDGYTIKASMDLSEADTEYYVTTLEVSADPGQSVDSSIIRKVRVEDLKSGITRELAVESDCPSGRNQLADVARSYARASLDGLASAEAVRERMGVSIATAGRLIRRAREAGYLPHRVGGKT